jgi:hypothetical protein
MRMRRMLTCATAEMHAHARCMRMRRMHAHATYAACEMHAHATYADMPQHSRIALVSAVACFTDIGDAKRLQFTAIFGK